MSSFAAGCAFSADVTYYCDRNFAPDCPDGQQCGLDGLCSASSSNYVVGEISSCAASSYLLSEGAPQWVGVGFTSDSSFELTQVHAQLMDLSEAGFCMRGLELGLKLFSGSAPPAGQTPLREATMTTGADSIDGPYERSAAIAPLAISPGDTWFVMIESPSAILESPCLMTCFDPVVAQSYRSQSDTAPYNWQPLSEDTYLWVSGE